MKNNIKFKFVSKGISGNTRKNWLPKSCKTLPKVFTLVDIPKDAFAASIMKRLSCNLQDGTVIKLRTWRCRIMIGIMVINLEQRKASKSAKKE